jgi:hypothetical protein
MNPPSPAPLLFFRVLADPLGKPAGLLIVPGAGVAPDAAALAPLAASWPCLFRPGLGPALAQTLGTAGWRELTSATLCHIDERLDPAALPPHTSWLDGDWCFAPPAKAPGTGGASRALALQLVQRVAADADNHEIEALLRQDPALSYHLLRLVNSLSVGTRRRITSFSQAILLLGRQQLRRWLNLMLFAAREGDVRSAMLLARVALRARTIELLARARGLDKDTQEQGFMTGMFSLIGVLFGMSLPDLLAPLAMSDQVQGALLRGEGELGELLQLVETAERGALDDVAAALAPLQLSAADFNAAALAAAAWMVATIPDGKGSAHG